MSDDTVWVVPMASPSRGTYHTTRCFNVTDRHVEKPAEWARRSRLEECAYCAGTADSQDHGYDSPARQLKGND